MALALVWVVISLSIALPAAAAGPPRYPGDLGAALLLPNQAILVEIEQVRLKLPLDYRSDEVQVTYRLLNRGPGVSQGDLFIMARGWRWQSYGRTTSTIAREITAELRGLPLPSMWPRVDPPIGDEELEEPRYHDPLTGGLRPDVLWNEVSSHTQATRFLFDLAEGETAVLVVTYKTRPTYEMRSQIPIYHYHLPLRIPGTHWEQSGTTVLVESERAERFWVAADLPVTRSENRYAIKVHDPGAQSLSISMMSREGTLFGWVDAKPYYYFLAGSLLILNLALMWLRQFLAARGRLLSLTWRIVANVLTVLANLSVSLWVLTSRPVFSLLVTSAPYLLLPGLTVVAFGWIIIVVLRSGR